MPHRLIHLLLALVLSCTLATGMDAIIPVAHGDTAQAAALHVSRSTLGPGDAITVAGSGFTPGDSVLIYADLKVHGATSRIQTTATANQSGAFSASYTVPAGTDAGVYTLQARDFHNHTAAQTLYVVPLAFLAVGQKPSTTTVVAGTWFFAAGSGFKPGDTVDLTATFPRYDGNSVTENKTVKADGAGRMGELPLQVPPGTKSGTYTLTATGKAGGKASADIKVIYQPSVVLDTQSTRPGGAVTVTGHGFVPYATIHVAVPVSTGSTTTTVARDVSADGAGSFTATLTLPANARAGKTTVTASDMTGQFSTTAALTVTLKPVLAIQPNPAWPGQIVKVTGTGYSANATVTVKMNFPLYGGGSHPVTKTVQTDGQGNFSISLNVPGHATAGNITATASGPSAGASARLVIEPIVASIRLSPALTSPGTTIAIAGSGYPSGDRVFINMPVRMTDGSSRTLSTAARADAHGTFTASLRIPGTAAIGNYTVTATSELTGRAPTARVSLSVSAHITVQPGAVLPGHTVVITGGGFGAGVNVTVTASFPLYGGGSKAVTTTATTDQNGTFTARIAAPSHAAAGQITVSAKGPNATAHTAFAVHPLAATVSAAPASVIPGSTLAVTGNGFAPNDTVDISVAVTAGGKSATLTATAHADAAGAFHTAIQVPGDVSGGSYTLTARSEQTGRAPVAHFSVAALAPSIVAAPSTAVPGTDVSISGFGFAAGAAVKLSLQGQQLGSATADASGKFSTKLTIPAGTATGSYTVTAQGNAGRTAQVTLAVQRQVSTHFYFASFYTGTNYQESIAIVNPTAIQARVTITYQEKSGATTEKVVTIPAHSRYTEDVNADIGSHVAAGAVIAADVPVVAERLMRHGSDAAITPGAGSPSSRWYFADGNTSGHYREYLALQNPSNSQVQVNVQILPAHRHPFTVHQMMQPHSRATLNINSYVRGAVGLIVSSGAPVVANRTIFDLHGVTSKIGATQPQRSWYFAAGPQNSHATYWIAAINPSGGWARVTLHAYDPFGQEVATWKGWLKPHARAGYQISKLTHHADAAVVLTASRGIVAEQTTYVGRMHDAATDTFGITSPARAWGFAAAGTLNGESDSLSLFNPSLTPIPVVVQFISTNGTVMERTYVVSPLAHERIDVGSVMPNAQLGMTATSDYPFVALNQLSFDNRLGSDTSHGIPL